jgi:3-oxoadipate enol-lactonase
VGSEAPVEDVHLIHSISLITEDGGTHAVRAAGSGPPVIFLHGFPLNSTMWLPLIELLQPYFHCIAPDFRGFGGSSLGGDYQISDLAKDIETIRIHLTADSPIHLVGLSMGGYVAFEYWRLFGHNLRSLTLTNTKPSADDSETRSNRMEMSRRAGSEGARVALEPMLTQLLADCSQGSQAEVQLREMIDAASPQAIAAAQAAMAGRRDFLPLLSSLATASLVAAGQYDQLTPTDLTRQWAGQLPSGRFGEIPDSGHLSPLESAPAFSSLLFEFLNSVNAAC